MHSAYHLIHFTATDEFLLHFTDNTERSHSVSPFTFVPATRCDVPAVDREFRPDEIDRQQAHLARSPNPVHVASSQLLHFICTCHQPRLKSSCSGYASMRAGFSAQLTLSTYHDRPYCEPPRSHHKSRMNGHARCVQEETARDTFAPCGLQKVRK